MARELINRIQNLRKEKGFEITDRISVILSPNTMIEKSVKGFNNFIKSQVLANEITIAENEGVEVDFDTFKINITINKI